MESAILVNLKESFSMLGIHCLMRAAAICAPAHLQAEDGSDSDSDILSPTDTNMWYCVGLKGASG